MKNLVDDLKAVTEHAVVRAAAVQELVKAARAALAELRPGVTALFLEDALRPFTDTGPEIHDEP